MASSEGLRCLHRSSAWLDSDEDGDGDGDACDLLTTDVPGDEGCTAGGGGERLGIVLMLLALLVTRRRTS